MSGEGSRVVGTVRVIGAVKAVEQGAAAGGGGVGGRKLVGAVWVVGVVRAVRAVRARGGPGTHWQPLNFKL